MVLPRNIAISELEEIKCWANQVEANLDQLVGTVSTYGTDSVVNKAYMTKIYGKSIQLA